MHHTQHFSLGIFCLPLTKNLFNGRLLWFKGGVFCTESLSSSDFHFCSATRFCAFRSKYLMMNVFELASLFLLKLSLYLFWSWAHSQYRVGLLCLPWEYKAKQQPKTHSSVSIRLSLEQKFSFIFMIDGPDVGKIGIHIVWVSGQMNFEHHDFCNM